MATPTGKHSPTRSSSSSSRPWAINLHPVPSIVLSSTASRTLTRATLSLACTTSSGRRLLAGRTKASRMERVERPAEGNAGPAGKAEASIGDGSLIVPRGTRERGVTVCVSMSMVVPAAAPTGVASGAQRSRGNLAYHLTEYKGEGRGGRPDSPASCCASGSSSCAVTALPQRVILHLPCLVPRGVSLDPTCIPHTKQRRSKRGTRGGAHDRGD